jgi:hypothetical protein
MYDFGLAIIRAMVKAEKSATFAREHHLVSSDLCKFYEQMDNILQWDQSNKNYVLTHGVSGVDWTQYKHSLPERVYDAYCNTGET